MPVTLFSTGIGYTGIDPWTNLDGRLNAPSGIPQRPTILNGYPLSSPPNVRIRWPNLVIGQPPWKAAGVDYPVGPRSTPLNDPNTITTTDDGINFYRVGNLVHCHANNTLSGYDMSGGWSVEIDGDSVTIQDCHIVAPTAVVGSGKLIDDISGGSNLTLQYNILDGNGVADFPVNCNASGTLTLLYNYVLNSSSDMMNWSVSNDTIHQSLVCMFNLWDGGSDNPGAHADLYQTQSGTRDNETVQFNTYYINNPAQGTQGLGVADGTGTSRTVQCNVSYNTFVALGAAGGGALSYAIGLDGAQLAGEPGPWTFYYNHCDPTTTPSGAQFFKTAGTFGTGFGLSTSSNNVNMATGTVPAGSPWNS